jgi:hypothetical protein
MIRYRELYTKMAEAVEQARKDAHVDILVGGCSSTSNALDKLFPDGSETFLDRFDFCSIHYQGLTPYSTIKMWVDRKSPRGRVKIWDTESWVANTDDRVAAVVSTNRSAGYDRAMGIFHENICEVQHPVYKTNSGKEKTTVVCAWSVAASIGAVQHFIGERSFKEVLFKKGLPWINVFDGLYSNPDDGTIVITGDIGEEYGPEHVLFRTVRGLKEVANKEKLKKQLGALNANTDHEKIGQLKKQIRALEVLSGATMSINNREGKFSLYDFYGNQVECKGDEIEVPLDHRGFFLRTNGSKGSFVSLLESVKSADIEGFEPLETIPHDLIAPIESSPDFHLTLTNILNRPVKGFLKVKFNNLGLEDSVRKLSFKPYETKELYFKTTGITSPDNTYPFELKFEAGHDGIAVHEEDLHVNFIAKRSIDVDGNLEDWRGLIPQTVKSDESSDGQSLTEAAWFPFLKYDKAVQGGFSNGYLAYDETYFYFGVKIADDTPEEGMRRFDGGDENYCFYPDTVYAKADNQVQMLLWPQDTRNFSYRQDFEIPSGNGSHDNVQIAFNVLGDKEKKLYPFPPGTMPKYINYQCSDYEYALNPVAQEFGGGTEMYRLRHPGMPFKHHFPRQPRVALDGTVKGSKLSIIREGNTRITEAAIPWSEIPEVKKKMEEGKTIKFSFRVNDNTNRGCMELSRWRSVAKRNGSFQGDWSEHWANELEFGFQK